MKLWHISQTVNNNWDTYDSAVVAAKTELDARRTHPSGSEWYSRTWCGSPDDVHVEYIGEAKKGTKSGVTCASFHAG